MITITVDLSAATEQEAQVYFSSRLRALLLDPAPGDLQGCSLVIALHEAPYLPPEALDHFAGLTATTTPVPATSS